MVITSIELYMVVRIILNVNLPQPRIHPQIVFEEFCSLGWPVDRSAVN